MVSPIIIKIQKYTWGRTHSPGLEEYIIISLLPIQATKRQTHIWYIQMKLISPVVLASALEVSSLTYVNLPTEGQANFQNLEFRNDQESSAAND